MDLGDNREFCKVYKRVMDVELKLKERFKFALTLTFPNKMFYKLIPYIKKELVGKYKKCKGKNSRDLLSDLISSNKIEEEKINKFVDMAYLSDILRILTEYEVLYKDVNFNKNFYGNKVDFNNLKKNSSRLKKLRNTIMHFNIFDYKQAKEGYIEALVFWEKLLLCTNSFIHSLPSIRPTMKNIILQMRDYCPDFYTANDRYLRDVFDDIAFKNGLSVEKLPQYWSIGRKIYEIKSSIS